MKKKGRRGLDHLHREVPGSYYDNAIENNIFQRYWHKKRFYKVSQYLENNVAPSVLDVGCHGGTFTNQISKVLPESKIFGIDISENAIKYAKKKYKKISFSVARAEALPFKKNSFELVTCFEVLEHVKKPKEIIKEFFRILKPGGNLIIIVPTEVMLFEIIWFFWTKLGPGRVWTHTHIQKFKNYNLDNLLKDSKFKIINRHKFIFGMLLIIYARK